MVRKLSERSFDGAMYYQGDYNASTNTPDLDASPLAVLETGDTYRVSVAGNFFATAVGVGDLLVAKVDNPASASDWAIMPGSAELVKDLSPQLGANLDLNSNDITGTGNIDIVGGGTFQKEGANVVAKQVSALGAASYAIYSNTGAYLWDIGLNPGDNTLQIVNVLNVGAPSLSFAISDGTVQLGANLDTNGHNLVSSGGSGAVDMGAGLNMNGNIITDDLNSVILFGHNIDLGGNQLVDSIASAVTLGNYLDMNGNHLYDNGGTVFVGSSMDIQGNTLYLNGTGNWGIFDNTGTLTFYDGTSNILTLNSTGSVLGSNLDLSTYNVVGGGWQGDAIDDAYISSATTWNAKQDALTFDASPTDSSTNPVESNGIFDALSGKLDLAGGTMVGDLTVTPLAGLANSILLTDVNGKLVDSTATITDGPAGGSVLNLQEYPSDPAVGDRVAGDAWILESGGQTFFKYWNGLTLKSVELT